MTKDNGSQDFLTSAGADAYYEKLSRIATRMHKYWSSFKALNKWRLSSKARGKCVEGKVEAHRAAHMKAQVEQ